MDETGVFAREFPQVDRVVEVGVASGRVISVSFPDAVSSDADPDHPVLDRIAAALDGDPDADLAAVEVALTVPTDRRRVLEATREIPRGETATPAQVARLADLDPDDEDDAATVREALAANPVPLLVPDHRVPAVAGATPPEVGSYLRDVEG
jgi:methylated-DNA-[protein]-cysteine S-methyltransferase